MQGECEDLDGDFGGEGSTCIPYPCHEPWACCLNDGSCAMLLREDCWAQDGEFQGHNITCSSNPCEETADVEENPGTKRTWGRIKSGYR